MVRGSVKASISRCSQPVQPAALSLCYYHHRALTHLFTRLCTLCSWRPGIVASSSSSVAADFAQDPVASRAYLFGRAWYALQRTTKALAAAEEAAAHCSPRWEHPSRDLRAHIILCRCGLVSWGRAFDRPATRAVRSGKQVLGKDMPSEAVSSGE